MSNPNYTQGQLEEWLDKKCGESPAFKMCFLESIGKMREALDQDPDMCAEMHVDPDTAYVVVCIVGRDLGKKVLLSWGPEVS